VGGGASCAVFRCFLFGVPVAVKLLKAAAVEWEAKQFESESALLTKVSHVHICRLFAFSTDGPQRCLVLELCVGGTLSERLACKPSADGSAPPRPLLWRHRVQIAVGVASALEYLHALTPQQIHRDLKSQNILLDAQGVAKVADFGTVRDGVTKGSATHTLTRAVVGTTGYMPPEYITQGFVSDKLDIYAFAVVLVELLTGKAGIEVAALHCEEPDLFPEMQRYVDGRAGAWPPAVVTELAAAAEQCMSHHARVRPTASQVIRRLEALV
jgi:serine/threonine protein kinase